MSIFQRCPLMPTRSKNGSAHKQFFRTLTWYLTLRRPIVLEVHVPVMPDLAQTLKLGSDHFENLTNFLAVPRMIISVRNLRIIFENCLIRWSRNKIWAKGEFEQKTTFLVFYKIIYLNGYLVVNYLPSWLILSNFFLTSVISYVTFGFRGNRDFA